MATKKKTKMQEIHYRDASDNFCPECYSATRGIGGRNAVEDEGVSYEIRECVMCKTKYKLIFMD